MDVKNSVDTFCIFIKVICKNIRTVHIAKECIPFWEISEFSFFLNLFLFLSDCVILKNPFYTENFEKQRVTLPYHIYKSYKKKVLQNIPQIILSFSCSCVCIFENNVCVLRVKRQTDFHIVFC